MSNPTISLELVASPSTSPILFKSASATSFANNYYKLSAPNLSQRDRNSIRILGLLYCLAAGTGPNYKAKHAALIQDAIVYNKAISHFDIQAAHAVSDWDAGKTLDSSLSSDIPTLIAEARDLVQLSNETQQRIISYLRVQLGN